MMFSTGITTLLHMFVCWIMVFKSGLGSRGAALANAVNMLEFIQVGGVRSAHLVKGRQPLAGSKGQSPWLGSSCHFVCWIMVFKSGLGSRGAALANAVSLWINVLLLALYFLLQLWSGNSDAKLLKDFLFQKVYQDHLLAINYYYPLISLEIWSFEMTVLLSGLLPNPQLETSVLSINLNTCSMIYMIPLGLSGATSVRVSNDLGAGRAQAARRRLWGYCYSSDEEVVSYIALLIIGAGISGLVACKYCLSKGFNPIVFESMGDIGGVWAKTIRSTRLQTYKGVYQFADFPWPSSVTQDYPSQHQLVNYLRSYATHFDLIKHIQFNSVVKEIDYQGPLSCTWSDWNGIGETLAQGKWKVTVECSQTETPSIKVYESDFVILCVGRFKDVPNIPTFATGSGPEVFRGKVIHSMEYSAMEHEKAIEFVKGKKVVVVGFQKQGLDIAMECSSVNGTKNPCTIVYRKDRWKLPDFSPWGIPLQYLYLNRFSELIVHKPGEGFLLGMLATILSPLRWWISKLVETHIKRKLPLTKFNMIPEHNFSMDMRSCLIAALPSDFFNRIETGSILMKKCPRFSFYNDGVLIDGESKPIQADIVILATGFGGTQKLKNIFTSQDFSDSIAVSPDSRVGLYRECIQPRIPQLAIIGFSESFSNLFTSEIRCRWLVELLDRKFKLPSIKEMEKDISNWDECMKKSSGEYYKRSCTTGLDIWYNDQLCKDMGWNPKRKNPLFRRIDIIPGAGDEESEAIKRRM
ncbi:probable flavin-containing monooxygenase 1 [Tanacetum coccineum]